MKAHPKGLVVVMLLIGACPAIAQTTIDPANKYAYGANVGWINLAGDQTNGIIASEYICSGYAFGANIGWIDFGDGTPNNGIAYSNATPTDYGVNVTNYHCPALGSHVADLRGYAYGANIGWIHFESMGDPRIDLTTGKLLGYAWGANIGWINLGEISPNVNAVTSLAPSTDRDEDGIADAYEYTHAGFPNLTVLGDTPGADFDGDGQSDRSEYWADTDPTDSSSRLSITAFSGQAIPDTYSLVFRSSFTRVYHIESNPNLSSPWVSVIGPIKPIGAITTQSVTDPGGDSFHYWRVSAELPLQP